jgi:hypothetical protein
MAPVLFLVGDIDRGDLQRLGLPDGANSWQVEHD